MESSSSSPNESKLLFFTALELPFLVLGDRIFCPLSLPSPRSLVFFVEASSTPSLLLRLLTGLLKTILPLSFLSFLAVSCSDMSGTVGIPSPVSLLLSSLVGGSSFSFSFKASRNFWYSSSPTSPFCSTTTVGSSSSLSSSLAAPSSLPPPSLLGVTLALFASGGREGERGKERGDYYLC